MTCKEIKIKLDEYFGFDIATKRQIQKYIEARCMYYYLTAKYVRIKSYEDVANPINIKAHGTIINGKKAHESFCLDIEYKTKLYHLEEWLKEFLPEKLIQFTGEFEDMDKLDLINRLEKVKKINQSYYSMLKNAKLRKEIYYDNWQKELAQKENLQSINKKNYSNYQNAQRQLTVWKSKFYKLKNEFKNLSKLRIVS